MICSRCKKNKAVTFHRVGGEVEHKGEMKTINPFESMCQPCIKKYMDDGKFFRAPIITNPTIMPSGDPLEWVLNDE